MGLRLPPLCLEILKAVIHGYPFNLSYPYASLIIQPRAVVLALVIADMAGNSGQGIPGIDQLESFSITLFTYQPDIFGNILVNGAGRFTGRRIAVGQGESLVY